MPNGTSKVVVDAERSRRTLEKPASESSSLVWCWGQLQFNETGVDNGIEWHEKGTKMGAKIIVKSIRNRGGAAEAS